MHQPRKRFGQHFLEDDSVIERLVAIIAPSVDEHIVEIGPGHGALTLPVLRLVNTMDAIELDRDIIPTLRARAAPVGQLTIHETDALRFDFATLAMQAAKLRIIGNLPYNISTPLIFHLLDYSTRIKDMHFMLQKEVVDRLAAVKGTADYGRLSIMVQYRCAVTALFDVPPEAFNPPPRVNSRIVRLQPYQNLPYHADDFAFFQELVKQAFSQRRKTLRNCLKNLISDEQWQYLPIAPTLRAEQLTVADYVTLSNLLSSSKK